MIAVSVLSEPSLALKMAKSAALNAPRAVAEAVGRLNVCVAVALEMAKSLPSVPVAKSWVAAVRALS